MTLAGKTLYITGASRGIGLAIALRAARDGANVAIAAKTATPHPKLPGTIHSAADEIRSAGGQALPLKVDVRNEEDVARSIEETVAEFGGIDIVVNNASAIDLSPVRSMETKRFDLMHRVNTRGSLLVSKLAIPHLESSQNPHILMISPPLDMAERWFAPHTAYSIAKFGMSLVTLGMAGELRPTGIAVNALWPRTTIATSAIRFVVGGENMMKRSRKPDIMADAAVHVFNEPSTTFTGNFLIDDTYLASKGTVDFARYSVEPGVPLQADFFVPDSMPAPAGVDIAPSPAVP